MVPLIAAAAPILGSVASSIMGQSNARDASFQNHEWEVQAWNRDWQANYDNWVRQNEYNDPKNARARLEKAGYNPNAQFGAIGTGNVAQPIQSTKSDRSPVQAAQTPDFANAANSTISAYNSIRLSDAQADLLKEEAATQRSEQLLKFFQAGLTSNQATTESRKPEFMARQMDNMDWETAIRKQDWNQRERTNPVDLKQREANYDMTVSENAIMKNRDNRDAARFAVDAKEAASRILLNQAHASKSDSERQKILLGIRELESSFYDPARNDNSIYYYNQVGKLVSSVLQGAAAGAAAGGFSKMFKQLPKPTPPRTTITERYGPDGNLSGHTYSTTH